MPVSILALNYWLHLIATIIWVGGLAALILVIWPGISVVSLKNNGEQHSNLTHLLDVIENRFRALANLSLVVLITTGVIQMADDPHYEGFLKIDSIWAIGMLAKHAVIALIIALMFFAQFNIGPALSRAVMLARKGNMVSQAEESKLRARLKTLNVVSFALGVIVLLLTAIITAVP
jgi:uncharacterized membrane protein